MQSVREFINSVAFKIGVGPKWTTLNRGCVRLLGGVVSAFLDMIYRKSKWFRQVSESDWNVRP